MLHLLAASNGASTLHLANLSFNIAYPACERSPAEVSGTQAGRLVYREVIVRGRLLFGGAHLRRDSVSFGIKSTTSIEQEIFVDTGGSQVFWMIDKNCN